MNRIDRLMATILLLQGRRRITAEEIAAHFEVSLRTVYRDIAALSEGGVPVVAEAGVGYSLMSGYSIPPVMFTPEEASALFLGGELVDHLTDRSLQQQMKSALLKIRAVLPRTQQEQLDRLERTTALLIPSPGGRDGEQAVLARVQAALACRQVLEIRYRGRDDAGETRRKIEPLGLIYYSDHWHLVAWCRLRRALRDFRTDRILELAAGPETFEGHRDFCLRDHVASWRERFETTEVKVRIARAGAARFRRVWLGAIVEEQWEGDWLRLTILADDSDWFLGWLLGFGRGVEVLSPGSVREALAALAWQVARHHARSEETLLT